MSDILLNQLRLFVIPNSASYVRYTPESVTFIRHPKLCILLSDILLNQLRLFVIPNSASYVRYTPESVTFIRHPNSVSYSRYTPESVTFIRHPKLCILFQIYSWISYVYSSSQTLHLMSDILLNQLRLFVIPNSASYVRYTPKSDTFIRHPNSASYFRYTPESVTFIRHPKLCILCQIYS